MPDDTATPDYRDTLFLPQTDFPMRAGLPKKEPEILARWREMKLYERLREDAKGQPTFTLHDGPPYANGHLHMGHALNKVLKDIVVRSRQMSGFDAPYVPGWDCHGLPIEWQVEKAFKERGRTKAEVPSSEFRTACRDYAREWVGIQSEEFRRLGIEGDWGDPYTTMAFSSEAAIVAEFLRFAEKGQVYRGSKPVMWSPVEQTALAEAEIEYHEHTSTTIWVRFGFRDAPEGLEDAKVVIWTTTPWTIPGNRAVAYGPTLSYGLYEVEKVRDDLGFEPWTKAGDKLLLADALAEDVREAGFIEQWRRVRDVPTALLKDATLDHPLKGFADAYGFAVPLLTGDHVTDEAGTGFVHTAPSHGQEDYFCWLEHGLPLSDVPYTVDETGTYTDEAPGFTGEQVFVTSGKKTGRDGGANKAVIAALMERGALFARGRLAHSYPHSWRSKAPVLFRNTPQWFIPLGAIGEGGLRDRALKAVTETRFFPASGQKRIRAMVEGRPDWLVSRQRAWGVPITLFVDQDGKPLIDPRVNARVLKAIRERGADAWFDTPKEAFLGDAHDASAYEKVEDILDVWFDSGSTHAFVLEARKSLSWPADLYLEGSDQHRGWFQSSLLESCGTRGRAPYNAVLTHGFVLDGQGRKMSKSLGNVILPEEITQKYGADILRIWAASADSAEDMRISDEIVGSAVDAYRKMRNSLRYMLAALDGYDESEALPHAKLPGLERYVLHRLDAVEAQVREAYEGFDFKAAWRALSDFCAQDLSAFYFDVRKDSLYCDAKDDPVRRAARGTMSRLFENVIRWLAPICPFTAEEAFLVRHPEEAEAGSVHLQRFLVPDPAWRDDELAERWERIRTVRRVVNGALEVARREKKIGASLEAAVMVTVEDPQTRAALGHQDIATLFIVSDAALSDGPAPAGAFRLDEAEGVAVSLDTAKGEKCARCWRVLEDVAPPSHLCGRCHGVVSP
ncbi:isoleucine--tRNA ligase [Parvularcula dongshanensis]|uniref:Isoleucine--tRNA ligase n=1 Tax=Parvularcula dongshanensis TaxID=1173995 RepID=A0A840I245_9PROT|nr:isoleucine--tRNA ligase [Parvularcula dongshanensis]MBB4658817.1 isoleucyl-tRNA synthetase [Parvularcula dongshanensis]